jgi:hypothetical protein
MTYEELVEQAARVEQDTLAVLAEAMGRNEWMDKLVRIKLRELASQDERVRDGVSSGNGR